MTIETGVAAHVVLYRERIGVHLDHCLDYGLRFAVLGGHVQGDAARLCHKLLPHALLTMFPIH